MQYFADDARNWINVICDLEGVSGVVSFDGDNGRNSPNYSRSLRLASAELSALVRGLRAGGADRVTVIDGHGPGGLDIEHISEPCEVMIGRPVPPGSNSWLILPSRAQVLFGHHSMAGPKDANMAHTYSGNIVFMRLNGQPIGEIGFEILLGGCLGVRTIMITGDQRACGEARRYVSDIVAAQVKQGLSLSAAFCLPPTAARELIEENAREAMARLEKIPLPELPEAPYRMELQFVTSDPAQAFLNSKRNFDPRVSFSEIDPRTIGWTTDDLERALSVFITQGNPTPPH